MSRVALDRLRPRDLPRSFGRYELQKILGEGGMARVFRAELVGPAGFRKQVAVKVIKAGARGNSSESEVRAFLREARLGGRLKHPNIVDVYELGEAEGQFFIAMELVEGLTLAQLINSGAEIPGSALLEIAAGAAAGLASAHSLSSEGRPTGLVHRDLKPSNILLSREGDVKVADFGIATTRAATADDDEKGKLVGTVSYMSPEQLMVQQLDGRSDLFSLGIVLAEVASRTLLPRRYFFRRLQTDGRLEGAPLPPELLATIERTLPGLSPILLSCLKFSVQDRCASAEDLSFQLESLREQVGVLPRLRTWLQGQFEFDDVDRLDVPAPEQSREGETLCEPSTSIMLGPRARTNLGRPLDGFVGRESELTELARLLDEGARLVTVKGTGGAGKTRFSRRLARGQWDLRPGGAWFVDLTEARSPMGVVQTTATALDIPLGGDEFGALVEQLGHAIAGRGPVLLVLDNFEQVVDYAAVTLGRWLEMAPEASFLTTSREPLKLPGEQLFPLQPLPEEDGIALFQLRARAAGVALQEGTATRAAIGHIVRELDGLPLAIELAAARASLLSPAQLVDRLPERFRLLRSGRASDTRRQATLRGMIEWSWELLEPWEKAAMAQLTGFRGGFFMEAAEEVLDLSAWPEAPWPFDVVGSLLDKSLLRSWEVMGQPRFGMFVSVQEYATETLTEHTTLDRTTLALRPAAYYSRLGAAPYRDSLHTHGGTRRRRLLALERENLQAGVTAGIEAGDHSLASACALGAWELFRMAGPFLEGAELLGRVLELEGLEGPQRMRLLGDRAWLLHLGGRQAEAIEQTEEALALSRELSEQRFEGTWLGNLATLKREQGRISEALEHYDAALVLARELGDRRSEGIWLGSLGNLHKEQGRLLQAQELYEAALRLAEDLGDRRYEGTWLGSLGLLHMEQGHNREALDHTEAALALARELGHRRNEGIWLGNLGLLHRERGRTAEAIEQTEAALALARELGNRRSEGINLGNLGDLLLEQGEWAEAGPRIEEAIAIGDETWPVVAGVFRGSLALVRAEAGELAKARLLLKRGEEQLRDVHALELGKLLCKRSRIEHGAGDLAAAEAALAEARVIAADLELAADSELGQAIAEGTMVLGGS